MGQLVFWTSGHADTLKKVLAPSVKDLGLNAKVKAFHAPKKFVDSEGVEGVEWWAPEVPEGDITMAMGTGPVESLKKLKLVPGNLGIGKLRQRLYDAPGGGHYLCSWAPGIVFLNEQGATRRPEIAWDISLAKRFFDTGHIEPTLGQYHYVDTFEPLVRYVMREYKRTGQPVEVAADLETVGLDYLDPDAWIVSIAFCVKPGTGHMLYFENAGQYPEPGSREWQLIRWLLCSKFTTVRGANFKFDWLWIKHHFGIDAQWNMDTLLVGSLLDENRSNSLNLHTKIFVPQLGGYDDGFNAQFDKGKMQEVPKEDLLPYGAGDVDACLQVSRRMRPLLRGDQQVLRFYTKLLHPAARVFAKMEHTGMLVDIDRYEQLRQEAKAEQEENRARCVEHFTGALKAKYPDHAGLKPAVIMDHLFSPWGLNLAPQMISEKSQKPSTAKAHLQMFEDHPDAAPFIAALNEYRGTQKLISTYITGFLKHLRSDGRFHPTYMLHRGDYKGGDSGTVTGRSSAKDPAYQTIPKHTKWAKPLRSVYIAPPGYVVLAVDFSQGELRIAAVVAEEPTMIGAYLDGIDVHLLTGLELHNLRDPENAMTLDQALAAKAAGDPVVKAMRQGGKAGNFGLLYGMQPAGFQEYARTTYGVELTLEEATLFRDRFFGRYPRLSEWHDESINFAHLRGYVRNPLGRVRHIPLIDSHDWSVRSKAERQAINSPIQSCLSDLGQLAAVELDRAFPDLQIFGFTHDELTFYVPEDSAEEWANKVADVMGNLPLADFGWDSPLPFPAEPEIGPNLGNMTELDHDGTQWKLAA